MEQFEDYSVMNGVYPYKSLIGLMNMVKVIAHRGFHKENPDLIENTIPAFTEAVKTGAEVIELDVHLTRDEVWVVHHDFRFFNIKSISDNDLETIKQTSQEKQYRIDTLEDVLLEFPTQQFNIECKPRSVEIGQKLAEFLESKNAVDQCLISSFSKKSLRGARAGSENIKLSYIDLAFLAPSWKKLHEEISLYSINPFYSFTRKALVNRAHKLGIEVHCWTVNKTKFMKNMVKRGVDGIITDYPNLAVELIKEK